MGLGVPGDVGIGSRPVPACLGALGKKQLGNSGAQLVYRRAQRLSRDRMDLYKHTGGKHQAGDELFKFKDNVGTRTKGIN